jgi:hypothetical protein
MADSQLRRAKAAFFMRLRVAKVVLRNPAGRCAQTCDAQAQAIDSAQG